ncbi:hypothetical protein HPP92_024070 [Vanilla planifolia]|uniref:Receptor kinase-like protein Xa21 n=1 Tax=Vanilla planifolia TaxID=51239 RepID=A0A835UB39_VANPL|nr:hypothetical protein HPP92_024070 [Vanilla planifolia]
MMGRNPVFFWPDAIILLSLFSFLITKVAPSSPLGSSTTDQLALLDFKSALLDPLGAMSSWRNGSNGPCNWVGVTCGPQPVGRVTGLDLESLQLEGPLSSSLSNVTFLGVLNLQHNRFHGNIPVELGRLSELERIDLGGNDLIGEIPHELSFLPKLSFLVLGNNNLDGIIPPLLSNSSLTYVNLSGNHLSGSIPQVNNTGLVFLDLSKNNLTGEIPASIGTCSGLIFLDLSWNSLVGGIPPLLGTGVNLVIIDLSSNHLSQRIPPSLGNNSNLHYLSLEKNNLVGEIPAFFSFPSNLHYLYLSENNLSGSIPPSFGNQSSLIVLDLGQNKLQGSIPESLGSLNNLTGLYLSMNMFYGPFPLSFYNFSSIQYIALAKNKLSGMLLPTMGINLPTLQELNLQENNFVGSIPSSLCNVSGLETLNLPGNNFSGIIPSCLGTLQNLTNIDVGWNKLESHNMNFLSSLTNCTFLKSLILQSNRLQGELPASIGNLSMHIEELWVGANQISGKIPAEIGNLVNLTVLFMNRNDFTASIPSTICNLWKLNALYLSENKLTGAIPACIDYLNQLNVLHLEDNKLSGSIPPSLGRNWRYLGELNLSLNGFSGSIPMEVVSLSSLTQYLDLSYNSFSGSLPTEVASLTNLVSLNVSDNQLSGRIPSALANCVLLQHLNLERNFFEGGIPDEFKTLNALIELDLSHNNLSGKIPDFLGNFNDLKYLNLSFNNFDGEVPFFRNASAVSLIGNSKLCGGNSMFQLKPCSGNGNKSHKLEIILPVSLASAVLALLCSFCIIYRSKKKSAIKHTEKPPDSSVTYGEIFNATNGLSIANLVGSGSFGCVYKGKMLLGMNAVAVKVLNLDRRGAIRSFITECEVLRNVRHRNLLKILTLCSSVDSDGNEFKAFVFPYMPNGSLDGWLHSPHSKRLTFLQRLNIAIDVASALDYLHHGCTPSIVHCDLKPSNVLVDNDMKAVVGDFGLAKIMLFDADSSSTSTSLMSLRGSIGYVAPEYGMGNQISCQGDVYSFGILLLEMMTGKKPTDDTLVNGLNLRKFVELEFPQTLWKILDPHVLKEVKDERNGGNIRGHMMTCAASLIQVGLSCSNDSPMERMGMHVVVKELCSIKDVFLSNALVLEV